MPLLVSTRVETVQGETARYAPTRTGELRVFGHFSRTWPFHYGCVPGVLSTGDESLMPGPEGEDEDWLDVIVCGGQTFPGARVDCRVVGVALRKDGDHKLLTVAMEDPEYEFVESYEDLPSRLCGTVAHWFEKMGVHYEFAGRARAWQVIDESVSAGELPVNRYRSAGGLVTDGANALLLDRPGRDEVRLPKGHVERGESLEQAALRETKEESGLRGLGLVGDLGTARNVFYHDGQVYVRDESYFLYRWRGKQEKQPEHQFRRRWVAWHEARGLLTFAAERYFLREALRRENESR